MGEGTPLVLCNRFRGTLDTWDPLFVDALATEGLQVVTFDHSGLGRSTGTPSYDPAAPAGDAADPITALDLGRVVLGGWSLGGLAAQVAPQRRSDLRRRAFERLLDGPAPFTEVAPALVAHRNDAPGAQQAAQLDGLLRRHRVVDRAGDVEPDRAQVQHRDVHPCPLGEPPHPAVRHGVPGDPQRHPVRAGAAQSEPDGVAAEPARPRPW
ncbi:alpha/beta fold hydrolase [Saccharothrix saharensis]|uniref:alpha/beta fold hydrolase n=1 Tax=Saccharothrix saharensis TaxID=571190 RepID=UPI001479397C|nr:alpha/beta hydrolase [Saccharothrix saharensis]